MTNVDFINPKEAYPANGYTHVVSVETPAKILYISGQVSKDGSDRVVGAGDLEVQMRQVYKNLSNILGSMGASLADVVKQNIYTTVPGQIQLFRRVRDEFISSERPPASTYVVVAALADPDFLVEIEVVAVLTPRR